MELGTHDYLGLFRTHHVEIGCVGELVGVRRVIIAVVDIRQLVVQGDHERIASIGIYRRTGKSC